jgi:hypothetical protein
MARSVQGGPKAAPAKRVRKPKAAPAAASAVAPDPVPAAAPDPVPIMAPPQSAVGWAVRVLDRTFVLFVGLAVGATICWFTVTGKNAQTLYLPRVAVAVHKAGPVAAASQAAGPAAVDCALPFNPRLLKTVANGDPVNVGVFGDSFGEGIGAALYWTLPKSQHYQVFSYGDRSTGFTRYQSLNLEDKVAADIANQPIDIAVVSFGANDTQGIVDGGHVYPLLSPGWRQAYGRRVARYIALLRAQGAMVYWVGLPKMRNPEFDSQIVAMNDFYSGEMAALDVPFMPTEALSVDDKGEFSIRLVDPKTKKEAIMRADDGIHMSIPGYERITGPLVERIKTYVANSRDMAQATLAAAPGSSPPVSPAGRGL